MHMRVKAMSLFMAVIIAMGAFSGSAYAAETSNEGMTSSAMEDVGAEEEAPENETVLSDDAMKDFAISEDEITEDTSDEVEESSKEYTAHNEEEPVTMYTITLNANGGYFEDEWDDLLREYVDKEEVVNKLIKPGEAVKVIPVMELENAETRFLGWSLERNGEPIPLKEADFVPEASCTLFAVWEIEEQIPEEPDTGDTETKETEDTEEAGAGITNTADTNEEEETDTGVTNAAEYADPEEPEIGATDSEEYADPEEPGVGTTDSTEYSDLEEPGVGATDSTEFADPEEPGIGATELAEEIVEEVSKEASKWYTGDFTLTICASGGTMSSGADIFATNNGHTWLTITNNTTSSYDFYGYKIHPGCKMTLGLWGDQSLSENGLGGVFLNREFWRNCGYSVSYYSVTVPLNAIDRIKNATPAESYYHDGIGNGLNVHDDFVHNCTTYAIKMWNLAVDDNERFDTDWIDVPYNYAVKINQRNLDRYGTCKYTSVYGGSTVELSDVFHVNKEGELIRIDSFNISPADVAVKVGKSVKLSAMYLYSELYGSVVTWSTSDSNIATVANGVVTGRKKGNCIITASIGEYFTAECNVSVMSGAVYTVQDLKAISSNLSDSYVLMNDLDLKNEDWTPIGTYSAPFTGEFNGNGHTIRGLKVSGNSSYRGLFGVVKNAKISRITVSGSVSGNMYVGGIAGLAESSTLTYCINYASVSGVDQVGGVIGRCYKSTMKYCMNDAYISISGRGGGGISADIYPSGSITYCLNTGIVSGGNDLTGGIVGGSTSGTVSSCINAASVYYKSGRAGAIAGDNASYSGSRSYNYFLKTLSINTGFKVIGTECGTFTKASDDRVRDLRDDIINGTDGHMQEWPLKISFDNAKPVVGAKVIVLVSGCNQGLHYASSDPEIATISNSGIVTTKKVGKVTISVSADASSNYYAISREKELNVFPKAPSKVTAENLASGIKLTWSKAKDATRYYIFRDGELIKTIKKGSTVTFTDKTIKKSGRTYTYKVASGTEKGWADSRECSIYRLIRPAAPTVSNLYNRYIFVKCKASETISGFQIQCTTDKNFEKGRTTFTVEAASETSGYISNLKTGKRYYVRTRTYINKNGAAIYSAWSKGKSLLLGTVSSSTVSTSNGSSSNVRIRFSGTQTMATGTSRRIYIEGAGNRNVKVTANSSSVKIRKDSTSYIVTGNSAGSFDVTVTIGGTKKRFHIVVLSDKQIAEKVWAKVKKAYKLSNLEDYYRSRDNKILYVTISTPQGDGRPWVKIKVNLSTGRADCGESWQYFLSKISKSFLIW